MQLNRILHVIDSLALGGAEVLLVNTTKLLPDIQHVVVYLHEPSTLINDFPKNVELICLKHKGWVDILRTVRRLRNIIKEINPLLVHSHLFESTICARFATPNRVPLFNTLHSMYSEDAFKKNRKSLWMERMSLKDSHVLIGVSNLVLKDYLRYIPFKGKSTVLYNFLPDDFFIYNKYKTDSISFKCIAVGNLKEAKNYPFLLQVFSNLKNTGISLDIYGEGDLREVLQNNIDNNDLPVRLCGRVDDVRSLLSQYDLFIQASLHEGFGLSVIEAISSGLPVLLSDIEVFREITGEYAHFFSLSDSQKVAHQIRFLRLYPNDRLKYQNKAFDFCYRNFSSSAYKENLLHLYKANSFRV